MRRYLFILVLLFCQNMVQAQVPNFHSIKLNRAYNINLSALDTFGFIWLATQEGLVFYDGHTDYFVQEFEDEITSLSANGSTIWVGTETGIMHQYDALQRLPIASPKHISKFPIQNILGSQNLTIVTSYGEGIWIMNLTDTLVVNMSNGLLSNDIYDAILHHGKLWIGTDRGINVLEFMNDTLNSIDSITELPDVIITHLEHMDERIWAATYQNGIFNIDPQTYIIENYLFSENTRIKNMVGHSPNLLILTDDAILQRDNSNQDFNLLLKDNSMNTLLVDLENNLWLMGDQGKGLKANLYFYRYAVQISGMQAMNFTEKGYWFGTSSGLFRSEKELNHYQSVLKDQNITAIHQDQNLIWIGTYTDGVFVINTDGSIVQNFNKRSGLEDNTVLAIENLNAEQVVISTLSGVYQIRFKPQNSKVTLLHESFRDHYILSMYRQSTGTLWLGTDRNGIIRYDQDNIQTYSELQHDSLIYKIGSVYSMGEMDDQMWFSTTEAGLISLQKDELIFERFENNKIYTSIIPVNDQNMLLINQSGIDLFHRSKGIFTVLLELEDTGEELFLNNFSQNSEQIDFVWNDQIFRYVPSNKSFKIEPSVHLSQVEVNLDAISMDRQIFKQQQNNFSFFYTGNWLTNPEILRYQYRLKGFDQSWRTTRDKMASYPHLPPGQYTFQVHVVNESNEIYDSTEQFQFTIKRNFFNSIWFYLFLAILTYGISYWIFVQRKTRSQLKAELTKNQLEAEFMNLKSQINPHFLFNSFNTLIGLIEDDQERSIKFTEKLTDYYRTILETGEKQWIPISEELKLVRLYAAILSERYGENLSISIKIKNQQYVLPPLSIQMLVENAVKHNTISSKNKLEIVIEENTDYLIIRNNLNPKLTREPSTGIGLNNIRERLSHKTNRGMKVEKNENEFMIYLPKVR